MQVNISGHQLDVTDALRDYVGEKLSRLERHFDKITNVQVIMEVEKLKQKIEATLHIAGGEVVANAEHEDMYAAIDLLADKLDRQLIKYKEKQLDRLFAGDVLDITSDIAVMKAMLARDGLAEDLLEPEL